MMPSIQNMDLRSTKAMAQWPIARLSRSLVPVRSIVARLRPWLRQPVSLGKGEQRLTPKAIGDLGERMAAEWLWASGRKVLYRNFRAPEGGEVDIVAREGDVLCFIEVKTRTQKGYGRPLDAVDLDKQKLIDRGATEWLRLLGTRDLPWRFDVMEVILQEGERPEFTYIKDAF